MVGSHVSSTRPARPTSSYGPPHYKIPDSLRHVVGLFRGRANELNSLRRNLIEAHGPTRHPVVIYGSRGMGKTSICVKYAVDHSERYQSIRYIDTKVTRALDRIDNEQLVTASKEVDGTSHSGKPSLFIFEDISFSEAQKVLGLFNANHVVRDHVVFTTADKAVLGLTSERNGLILGPLTTHESCEVFKAYYGRSIVDNALMEKWYQNPRTIRALVCWAFQSPDQTIQLMKGMHSRRHKLDCLRTIDKDSKPLVNSLVPYDIESQFRQHGASGIKTVYFSLCLLSFLDGRSISYSLLLSGAKAINSYSNAKTRSREPKSSRWPNPFHRGSLKKQSSGSRSKSTEIMAFRTEICKDFPPQILANITDDTAIRRWIGMIRSLGVECETIAATLSLSEYFQDVFLSSLLSKGTRIFTTYFKHAVVLIYEVYESGGYTDRLLPHAEALCAWSNEFKEMKIDGNHRIALAYCMFRGARQASDTGDHCTAVRLFKRAQIILSEGIYTSFQGLQKVLNKSIWESLAIVHQNNGNFDRATEALERMETFHERKDSAHSMEMLKCDKHRARGLFLEGDLAQAITVIESVVNRHPPLSVTTISPQFQASISPEFRSNQADSKRIYAQILLELGVYPNAKKQADEARKISISLQLQDTPDAQIAFDLTCAMVDTELGEYEATVPKLESIIDRCTSAGRENFGMGAKLCLGRLYLLQRDMNPAGTRLLSRALKLFKEVERSRNGQETLRERRDHYDNYLVDAVEGIGLVHFYRNEMEEAKKASEQVYKVRKRFLIRDHLDTLRAREQLAAIEMRNGDAFIAITELSDILERERQQLAGPTINQPSHPIIPRTLHLIGECYAIYTKCGLMQKKAKCYLEEALSLKSERLGDSHPSTLLTSKHLEATKTHLKMIKNPIDKVT